MFLVRNYFHNTSYLLVRLKFDETCLFLTGNRSFEKMSSSKIAESDSGAEDDQEPVVTRY